MSVAHYLVANIPSVVLGLIMVAVATTFSTVGVLLVRRFVGFDKLREHNDVAGPIFGTLGVLYAVLLAFVVIVSWENYDRAHMDVVAEANNYANIYRNASGFDETFRSEVRERMDSYLQTVIDEDWPLLARGERSPEVQRLADQFWQLVGQYEPKKEGEKIFLAECVRQMNEAGEYRRQRLVDAQTGIHPLLWFVLLTGGVITVAFTFFFGARNLMVQLVMTNMLAVVIALILLTMLELDHPFSGDVSIRAEPFKQVLLFIRRETSGS